jgi:hypothetical protein
VDNAGNVYVADTNNDTIRKITPAGVVSTLAGLPGSSGSADGTGSAARFYDPLGLAVDSAGNVYVADQVNDTVRKITPGGVVSTWAGLAGNPGSSDGVGNAARFANPGGVAVDSAGNVYVADSANHTIRKIYPSRAVSTLGGVPGSSGSADGAGNVARFNYPQGIAVLPQGNVYVADTVNNIVRLGAAPLPLIAAVSHKMHGSFSGDIDLMPNGGSNPECRSGGGSGVHQLIMTFATATPVSVIAASVTPDPNATPAATGSVNSFSNSGSQITVNLTSVSNAQTLLLNLSVIDNDNSATVGVPLAVLLGDVNGSGRVDAADVSLVRQQTLQPITNSNFREDVNVSGRIDAADVSVARQQTLTSLP